MTIELNDSITTKKLPLVLARRIALQHIGYSVITCEHEVGFYSTLIEAKKRKHEIRHNPLAWMNGKVSDEISIYHLNKGECEKLP